MTGAQTALAVTPPPSVSSAPEWGGIVILAGGALALLGSFLPWISATAAFVGTVSRNGFDGGGDGIITAAIGLLIGLMGLALLTRSGRAKTARIGALIGAALLAIVAYLDIQEINKRIAGMDDNISGSVGTGLIVIAFAAVVTAIGVILPRSRQS